MSIQQMIVNNPPRTVNVPQQPLPQTVCTTLEHSGYPFSETQLVTDIPPSLSWMPLLQLYDHSFTYSKDDQPTKELDIFTVHNWKNLNGANPEQLDFVPWNAIPFLGSKWWTGTVSFKLLAIKPPRVTGKLLIRYSFDPFDDFSKDVKRRTIAKEWDLGQSDECEFDITGINTIKARPTWIPKIATSFPAQNAIFISQLSPMPTWHMGTIRIESAQRLQPGSIFPDSIRIMIFRVYKNASFYMPTDFRGFTPNMFVYGTESRDTQYVQLR